MCFTVFLQGTDLERKVDENKKSPGLILIVISQMIRLSFYKKYIIYIINCAFKHPQIPQTLFVCLFAQGRQSLRSSKRQ